MLREKSYLHSVSNNPSEQHKLYQTYKEIAQHHFSSPDRGDRKINDSLEEALSKQKQQEPQFKDLVNIREDPGNNGRLQKVVKEQEEMGRDQQLLLAKGYETFG